MNKALIFAIMFLIIPLASAANESINFNYPEEVNYGEEFEVSVELTDFSEGSYDVKIDILNSSDGRISRILNNEEWKSTFYYVNDAINTSEENSGSFKLNISQDYEGIASINVTIRNSASKTFKFGEYSLDVKMPEAAPEEPEDNPDNDSEENLSADNDTIRNETINSPISNSSSNITSSKTNTSKTSTALSKTSSSRQLTAKAISNSTENSSENSTEERKEVIYQAKTDKMKKSALYLAIGLFIVLIIYLLKTKDF